jgi:hypothetical protein
MKRSSSGILIATLALAAINAGRTAAQAPPPPAEQIAAAVLAAPDDRRAGARVLGYDAAGKLVTLRQGTNDMVCLADDPKRDGFEVDCYHVSLEPYMQRGRELTAEGVTGQKRYDVRWAETQDGKLSMPDKPAVNYTVSGARFDPATGKIENEYRRSTIYIPFATLESTGMSNKASQTDPWIMFPGTAGAHIMITPPRPQAAGSRGGGPH